ncbi:hypothetical protein [Antarcticirhabdus aurantiaca]|uniref:Uncharacterized protein n=1 Tax=Antarcticirhabdus aurantiaca TaxID=2606717 RepID=A0ACD4NMM8_9HYPH|nr:hypothetical protein [Antarcticirhabdus aurantiaca]WAJ28128.1 hypothetical protein OXU80_25450 [Jeongeuplla avenae]
MAGALASLVLAEIAERHAFFERWFNGLGDEDALSVSLERFDPAFRRIDPAGREAGFEALAASLSARRGSRAADPVSIAVEDLAVLWDAGDAVLAGYVEVQGSLAAPERHRRRSTALFVAPPSGGAPRWRHVQETTIQTGGA